MSNDSGWYRVDFLLPYLESPKEGYLVVFFGDMPTDYEIREVLVMEQKIKQDQFYFVKILAVKAWNAPKQKE